MHEGVDIGQSCSGVEMWHAWWLIQLFCSLNPVAVALVNCAVTSQSADAVEAFQMPDSIRVVIF